MGDSPGGTVTAHYDSEATQTTHDVLESSHSSWQPKSTPATASPAQQVCLSPTAQDVSTDTSTLPYTGQQLFGDMSNSIIIEAFQYFAPGPEFSWSNHGASSESNGEDAHSELELREGSSLFPFTPLFDVAMAQDLAQTMDITDFQLFTTADLESLSSLSECRSTDQCVTPNQAPLTWTTNSPASPREQLDPSNELHEKTTVRTMQDKGRGLDKGEETILEHRDYGDDRDGMTEKYVRLARNRVAAIKYRAKTRRSENKLIADVQGAQNLNIKLRAEESQLRDQVYELKQRVMPHYNCSPAVHQYLSIQAKQIVAKAKLTTAQPPSIKPTPHRRTSGISMGPGIEGMQLEKTG